MSRWPASTSSELNALRQHLELFTRRVSEARQFRRRRFQSRGVWVTTPGALQFQVEGTRDSVGIHHELLGQDPHPAGFHPPGASRPEATEMLQPG